ncbi:ABC transporter permease [Pectinatus cerevisiiphilus]|uniref:ABC-2 type transport system permease protein n=1 Tax=Pectinatus cerevisiiphilus TaxID=86956 RepID=A0A4R3K8H7_9FIRM|nr:ABC transporter permease [Pectinatus cerevisiiphilus]TCS79306.1 ABC-2 type transport system permease protein [Pectinatus cerevisiiphilus]
MKLKKIIRDEFALLFKGKFPIALYFFIVPILFSVLFSMVYAQNSVKHIPLVIFDQENSSISRQLVQIYNDSEKFTIVDYVPDQESFEEDLATNKALVGLSIPPDFTKKVELGDASNLLLVVNSTNNLFGNVALMYSKQMNQTFSIAISQKLFEAGGILPSQSMNLVYPIHMGLRVLNNPVTGYKPFMLPGLMLNGLQIGILLAVGPLLVREYKSKKYGKEYSSLSLLIGKTIPSWILAVLSYVVSMTVLFFIMDLQIAHKVIELLAIGVAFSFFVIQAMFFFSSISVDEVFSLQVPLVYLMPGLLFSGLTWPDFLMTSFGKFFSSLLPISYAAVNLRSVLFSESDPFLWRDVSYMLLFGLLAAAVTLKIFSFRRKKSYVKG